LARRHGWTEDQIQNLADFEQRDDFTPAQKTALRYAERVTLDSNHVDDALWNELRAHYDEGEVVEMTMAMSVFNAFNRFNNALQMEPTK
jgi:alkylhydroperoxidase family enzyme